MPTTSAEQFAFGHAYEPLIRVSCKGEPSAGLAKSWSRMGGLGHWRFILRDDARFWNGDRVTARDVVESWQTTGRAPDAVTARRMASLATVVDDSTLDVRLEHMALATLGNPQLGIAKRAPGNRWPLGTGSYRLQDVSTPQTVPQRSTVTLEPLVAGWPTIAVNSTTPSDGRDLVDGGADLIVTDDRSLSAYRTTRPGVASSLLDAAHTWVLVTHAPLTSDSGAAVDPKQTAPLRESLARDVVRGQARAASSSRWYPAERRCDPLVPASQPLRGSRPSARVVYRRGEAVAQALAERVVALAGSGDAQLALVAPELARMGTRATAAALPPNDFDAALRTGAELAYIVSVPRLFILGCDEAEALVAVAPWLAAGSSATFAGVVAPLVETRSVAVMIPGRTGFALTGDGTVTVVPSQPAPGKRSP
jgi:hypothetical protein